MTEQYADGAGGPSQAERAEDIFRRYPDISEDEAKEAVTFLRKGRHLDIGLVGGIAELRGNIEAFRQEHRRALNPGWGEHGLFILIFLLLMGGVVYFLAR